MKAILPLFTVVYAVVALLFAAAALALMGFAVMELWDAVAPREGQALAMRAATAIESIGLLAVALVGLEMAQTVVEEEVVRRVHVSAPTRVRRYLSRFLVVVVIALAIESLVAVVQALHERPETLPHAASVAIGAAALLASWGVFVRLNRTVEELEPEGIDEARGEITRCSDPVPTPDIETRAALPTTSSALLRFDGDGYLCSVCVDRAVRHDPQRLPRRGLIGAATLDSY